MLVLKNICKSFFGNQVLHDVNFSLNKGEIHALVGENGAGKSTLMKIISGLETADSGQLYLNDTHLVQLSPHTAILNGINIIHQELNIAHNLTVAENIFLGFEPRVLGFIKNTVAMNTRAQQVLDKLGADFHATDIAGNLTMGQQQQVEIAKALAHGGKIIILDEPTSSLSEKEAENLFEILRSLKHEGVSIIYISHRMNEIYQLADRLTVLRDGTYIGTLDKKNITDKAVITMMVGRTLDHFYVKEPKQSQSEHVLSVKNISGSGMSNISFEARSGEVLGFAGLIGAGRTELARLICGIDVLEAGDVFFDDTRLVIKNPADAIAKGIVYLPEDRKQQGLFLDMACGTNITINKVHESACYGVVKQKEINRLIQKNIETYSIKLASPIVPARTLSGGNQQKLLIARLMTINPNVMIFDEPTRGVDVTTKTEIYKLMHKMTREGAVVIFISSDLTEVIGLSHRVLVMREGEITGEIQGEAISQEKIMRYATGLEKNYVPTHT